jgi:hypothetical protein
LPGNPVALKLKIIFSNFIFCTRVAWVSAYKFCAQQLHQVQTGHTACQYGPWSENWWKVRFKLTRNELGFKQVWSLRWLCPPSPYPPAPTHLCPHNHLCFQQISFIYCIQNASENDTRNHAVLICLFNHGLARLVA